MDFLTLINERKILNLLIIMKFFIVIIRMDFFNALFYIEKAIYNFLRSSMSAFYIEKAIYNSLRSSMSAFYIEKVIYNFFALINERILH